jgi:hypothetical protein
LDKRHLKEPYVLYVIARSEAAISQGLIPGKKDCFAALIAMDGMYAENAGAFFCRKDA